MDVVDADIDPNFHAYRTSICLTMHLARMEHQRSKVSRDTVEPANSVTRKLTVSFNPSQTNMQSNNAKPTQLRQKPCLATSSL